MRALFLLLVVLNLGFFAWQLGKPAHDPAPSSDAALPSYPGLQLLSEMNVDDPIPTPPVEHATVASEALAEPSPPGLTEVAVEPEMEAAEEPEMVASEPLLIPAVEIAEPELVVESCLSVGPLASESDGSGLIARLTENGFTAQSQQTVASEIVGYFVLISPAATMQAAKATVASLEELGISDYYLFHKGQYRRGISLGLYKGADNATRRVAELAQQGVEAVVADRVKDRTIQHIEVRSNLTEAELEAIVSESGLAVDTGIKACTEIEAE